MAAPEGARAALRALLRGLPERSPKHRTGRLAHGHLRAAKSQTQDPEMKPQPKLDLYKLHKAEYAATRKPALVEVKPASYLAISGQGAPGGDLFTASIGALYGDNLPKHHWQG